ncbi:unnamed protein product [Parnassius apollo]|uniref:(apollo) hypothetical protein n=1 Tax=Parnassius apollo TaxID=110799 RepID=A0A8S3X3X6_PARAO|nr:unnamed protein product [Parnassius apollo]
MTDNTEVEVNYVSQRNKRRREEADEHSDMSTFINEILSMFMDLKVTMKEIKEQNIKLQELVDFTTKKYDEIIDKMQKIEENIKEDKKQGALTIVRRSSSRSKGESCSTPTDEQLDQVDLDTEHLPAVDTPDACDKAALR